MFTLISIFIIFLVSTSNGADNRYKTCSSELISCGNIDSKVGYPFWGGGRPKYCGHPALQIQCLNNERGEYPVLMIGKKDEARYPYDILGVTFSVLNVTFALQRSRQKVIPCSSDMKYLSEVFKFSLGVENITLLYNCQRNMSSHMYDDYWPNPSPCFVGPDQYQMYYLYNISARKEYASCSSFDVYGEQLSSYFYGGIYHDSSPEPLYRRFEVYFEYSSECIICNNSGGICGSSLDADFVCLCKNGASGGNVCRKSASRRLVIVGSASLVIGIGMLVGMLYCFGKRRSIRKFAVFWKSKAAKCPNVDAFLQIYGSFSLTRYTHANIKKITNCFKDKLGEGGYAIVYKGQLSNGRHVAVKVLKQSKGDGEDFLNEVASISRTNHVNIVALLGFCFEGNKRALIYEFLPNGSLEKFTFHGGNASNQSLPWDTLLNISIGIAKGLDYLHRGCNARILHFDIKPHNILLDEKFCPKISDFGLARLCPLQDSTISMLEARGTIGYIAPEVFCRTIGGVSHKSDVYSFGMMVLDMVCGRKNLFAEQQISSESYFPKWIYDQLELGKEDAFQGTTCDEEKALQRKMILVSLWCIQTYPSNRPSMSRVVDMLQGCLESMEIPPQPNLSSPPRLA